MAGDYLPPLVAELRGSIGDFQAKMAQARAELTATAGHAKSTFDNLASIGKGSLIGLGTGALAVGAASLKMAGDFQESMTQLVTGAGEAQSNIKEVSNGILDMAPQVGESTKALADAMFTVESAGYHGAAGLDVLKVAAEGARVGNAQLPDVANAVTSALNAYHLSAGSATDVMNTLTASVSVGKMHMQDLAGALATVMPSAAALGVPLNQVGAALATMTMQGTSASDAATYLRFSFMALANPTAKARGEMESLGIKSTEVSDIMTHQGLPQALQFITDHIEKKFKPGTAEYTAALANMVGGTRGMQATLELTGSHLQTFKDNVAGVTNKVHDGAGGVAGWSDVQKDFNFKLAQAKEQAEALGIKIGMWLIPKVEEATRVGMAAVNWLEKHKLAAEVLAGVIGGVLVTAIGAYTIAMMSAAAATIGATWPILLIIAGIAAYTAEFLWFVNHWHQGWDLIKQYAGDAWHWIDDNVVHPIVDAFHTTIVNPLLFMRDTFKTVWDTVERIVGSAKDFIVDHINLIIAIGLGPLGVAIDFLKAHWATIWQAVCFVVDIAWGLLQPVFGFIINLGLKVIETAVDALKKTWDIAWKAMHTAVTDSYDIMKKPLGFIVDLGIHVIKTEVDILKKAWDDAWGDLHTAVDTMWGIVQPILHTLKQTLDDLVGPLEKVAGAIGTIGGAIGSGASKVGGGLATGAGKVGDFFGIHLAEGGVVTRPTLAMIGEGGGPEVVLPLNNPGRMAELLGLVSSYLPSAAVLSGASGGSSAPISLTGTVGGGAGFTYAPTYQVTVAGDVSQQTRAEMQRMFDEHDRELEHTLASYFPS